MARQTVAELLPKPLHELNLEDVQAIVGNAIAAGGESLILEWKSDVTPTGLSKASAAFANTLGGLLIGGVDDASGDLVGFVPKSGDLRLWVKEVLRHHVTPMPPFDVHTIHLHSGSGRVVLLVLVDESSTTPHLLTSNGAIYVRSPGSSDPSDTVRDQGQLLELTTRGRLARERAEQRASTVLEECVHHGKRLFTLALVPTGCATDPVRDLFTGVLPAETLNPAIELFEATPADETSFAPPEWDVHRLIVARTVDRGFTRSAVMDPAAFLDSVTVSSDGAVQLQRRLVAGFRSHDGDPEPRGPRPLDLEGPAMGMLAWARAAIVVGRQLVAAIGGHGQIRVMVDFETAGRPVFYAESRAETAPRGLRLSYWTTMGDDAHDAALFSGLRADVLRGIGAPMQTAPSQV
jgi:hypothetical protein